MTRWHSPPAELYALVEHTPAALLLETAESATAEFFATEPCPGNSRLFIAPSRILIANDSTELQNLFAEIERAVAAGHYAAGFFTYECGHFFDPPSPCGQHDLSPNRWLGSESTTVVISSTTNPELSPAATLRALNNSVREHRTHNPQPNRSWTPLSP
jgi:hypothetical protein